MQIDMINILKNTGYKYDKNIKQAKSGISYPNMTEVSKNSISEAIGRSQVMPFMSKRIFGSPDDYVINKTTSPKGREIFEYNRTDGSYFITRTDLLGNIQSKDEYYPRKRMERKTFLTKEGITRIIKLDDETITQKFRANKITDAFYKDTMLKNELVHNYLDTVNKKEYCRTREKNGVTYLIRIDETPKRKITYKERNGNRYEAFVTDLTTNELVKEGDLILDKDIYDKEKDEYYTQNILTGFVTERTQYRDKYKKNIDYQVKYFDKSTRAKYTNEFDYRKAMYTEKYFNLHASKPYKIVQTTKDKKEVFEFDDAGIILKEHYMLYLYPFTEDKVETKLVFDIDDDKKITSTIDYKKGYQIHTYYKRTPNVPVYSDYKKDDIAYKHIEFRKDGSTLKDVTEILPTGEAVYTKYNSEEDILYRDFYDSADNLYMSADYRPGSKKPAIVTKYNIMDSGYTQYIYDGKSKYPKTAIEIDKNGKVKTISTDFTERNTPKHVTTYYNGGVFEISWRPKARKFKKQNTEEVIRVKHFGFADKSAEKSLERLRNQSKH